MAGTVKATLRRMGNSQGVLIPKALLEQLGLTSALEMSVEEGAIVLRKPADTEPDEAAAIAAVRFALSIDDGLAFLRCWDAGDHATIRTKWPAAPAAVFAGTPPADQPSVKE